MIKESRSKHTTENLKAMIQLLEEITVAQKKLEATMIKSYAKGDNPEIKSREEVRKEINEAVQKSLANTTFVNIKLDAMTSLDHVTKEFFERFLNHKLAANDE